MIEQKRTPKRETVQLNQNHISSNFGSKFTFTVGSAYLGFGLIGFLSGAIFLKKPKFNLPTKRLLFSYYLKNMGQTSVFYANNAGGASMLYMIFAMGFSLMDEYLMFMNNVSKNAMIGLLAGCIYKLPRGPTASLVGGAVGLGITVSLNLITDFLRERDYIKFEMRIDA